MDMTKKQKYDEAFRLINEAIDLLDRSYLSLCQKTGMTPDPDVVAKYS